MISNLHPVPRPPAGAHAHWFGFRIGRRARVSLVAWITRVGDDGPSFDYEWRPVGLKCPIWERILARDHAADAVTRMIEQAVNEVMAAEAAVFRAAGTTVSKQSPEN